MNAGNVENAVEFPPFDVPLKLYPAQRQRAVAILLPAMGTGASYYQPFAEALATRGFSVLSPEIPGTATSRPRPSRKVDYGYRDLVEIYLRDLVDTAREVGEGVPVVLIGHSLGAHVGSLAVLSGSVGVDALVNVAGGNISHRNWVGAGAAKIRFAGRIFPLVSRLLGHFPGQYFGFGGPQARTLIREWSRVIFTGNYSHIYEDITGGKPVPALCVGFEGDQLAPEKSIAGLANLLNGEVSMLPVAGKGNPHSSWARNPVDLVASIDKWLGGIGVFRG